LGTFWVFIFGFKFMKKWVLGGVERYLVFEIDFGSIWGPFWRPKWSRFASNFWYTFENHSFWRLVQIILPPKRLLGGPRTALGGSGPDFWSIFDHFWKVYQKLDWSKVRFLNAEWTMLNAEWWMLTLSHSHTLILSHSHTLTLSHTHTLLHTLKRQDWIVLNANIGLFVVISKKSGQSRSPSQQRLLHGYVEKGKTEPLPLRTENSILLHRKTVPNPNGELSPSQQRTLHCCVKKDKTEPFPLPT